MFFFLSYLVILHTIRKTFRSYFFVFLKPTGENFRNPARTYIKSKLVGNSLQTGSVENWWLWAENTLMMAVYANKWYDQRLPYGLKGYIGDKTNYLVGGWVLRQIRVPKGPLKSSVLC